MNLMSNTAPIWIRSCSIAHQIHVVSTNAAMSLYGIMYITVCIYSQGRVFACVQTLKYFAYK